LVILMVCFSMMISKNVHFLRHHFNLDPVLAQLQLQTAAVISQQTVAAYCFLNSNGTVYDLNPLHTTNMDYNVTYLNKDTLNVNFCGAAVNNCPNRTALSTYWTALTNSCIALTGDATLFSNYTINFDNVTNITTLKAFLAPGDTCKTNASTNYSMAYNLFCNANQTTPVLNASGFSIANCYNEISVTTSYACPQFNIYGLWNAIMANKYAFGGIILGLGFILAFFGNKFLVFTEIMTGVILALFLTLYFILSNVSFALNTWQFWLIVGFSCLVGAIVGYFISKVKFLVAVILSGVVGYIVGSLLYVLALKYVQTNPTVVYWVLIVSSIIIFAIIGYWLAESIIIIATGVIGAYAVMRGAAFMIGYYPDEKQVYQLIQNKEWDQVNALFTWQVYVYFVAFLIIAVLGIFVQFKYFSDSAEKKAEEEEKGQKQQLVQK